MPCPTLESERLILASISLEDRDDIFQNFTEDIATYLYPQPPEKIEETEKFIVRAMAQNAAGTDMQLVIRKKETNEFIGCCGLHDAKTSTPEPGIWLKKNAHGNHFGREAVTRLKRYADENLTYDFLRYPVAKENWPSRKIAESLGGIVVKEFVKPNANGKMMDEVEYHIPR
jgi:RimJ/RimL family protein N-acetyltransferase